MLWRYSVWRDARYSLGVSMAKTISFFKLVLKPSRGVIWTTHFSYLEINFKLENYLAQCKLGSLMTNWPYGGLFLGPPLFCLPWINCKPGDDFAQRKLGCLLWQTGYMQDLFSDKNIIPELTNCVDPFIRVIDGIIFIGEDVAMWVSICTTLLSSDVSLLCQCPCQCIDDKLNQIGFVWADWPGNFKWEYYRIIYS